MRHCTRRIVAIVNNNKRLDDTNSRLARVEAKLDNIVQMLVKLGT